MAQEKTAHTPIPWKADGDSIVAKAGRDTTIIAYAATDIYTPKKQAEANAAFIVRAVNSHDALVAALPPPENLDLLAMWFDKYDAEHELTGKGVQKDLCAWAKNIRAALALAKSE